MTLSVHLTNPRGESLEAVGVTLLDETILVDVEALALAESEDEWIEACYGMAVLVREYHEDGVTGIETANGWSVLALERTHGRN